MRNRRCGSSSGPRTKSTRGRSAGGFREAGGDNNCRMCRNIRVLANVEPPATDDEIRASALQFVRKLSGTTRPSRANEEAFNQAVEEVTASARQLIDSLTTAAAP